MGVEPHPHGLPDHMGETAGIVPGTLALSLYGAAAWQETLDEADSTGYPDPDTDSMRNQFYCHWDWVRIVQADKPSWNLDSGLPDKGYSGFVQDGCN